METKRTKLTSIGAKQQLVILPIEFTRQFPQDYVAEWVEMPGSTLALKLVPDDDNPQDNKRYALVRHHGSAQVSLPRTFMFENDAEEGDVIEMYGLPEHPNMLFVRLVKGGE